MYDKVKQGNYSSISTKANVSHMKKTKRSQVSTCTAVHKPHSTSHQLVTSHVRYTTLPYEHDAAVLYNHNDRPPLLPPKIVSLCTLYQYCTRTAFSTTWQISKHRFKSRPSSDDLDYDLDRKEHIDPWFIL